MLWFFDSFLSIIRPCSLPMSWIAETIAAAPLSSASALAYAAFVISVRLSSVTSCRSATSERDLIALSIGEPILASALAIIFATLGCLSNLCAQTPTVLSAMLDAL